MQIARADVEIVSSRMVQCDVPVTVLELELELL
jgi:hypothetical protein